MWALALLAPFSVLMSDMPMGIACPLACFIAAVGIGDAWRHDHASSLLLLIPAGRGQATCNGQPMHSLNVEWRGPLAFLRWRDPGGHVRRLAFWPDTLPSASRRELRLAAMRRQSASGDPSVAR